MSQPTPSRTWQRSPRAHELSAAERTLYDTLDPARIPQHVAIIMDGNGRWAGKRALKRFLGHQQGAESVQYVVETASRIDLPWLTLYAFSLENNLRRPKSEVSFLMKLLKSYLMSNVQADERQQHPHGLHRPHPRATRRRSRTPCSGPPTQTAKNTGTTLTLALQLRLALRDRRRLPQASPQHAHCRGRIQRGITRRRHARRRRHWKTRIRARFDEHRRSHHAERSTPRTCPTPTSSSAPPASSASRTSSSGKSPTPRSSSPTASGPTSAAPISSKPSPHYQHRERRFGGLGETSDENLSEVLPAEPALSK